jgi:hypothetical protein
VADSDDPFATVRAMQQAAPATDGDPFAAVRAMPAPSSETSAETAPEPNSTWGSAAKGVGEAGLALGSGALRAITGAANDILPGDAGRAAVAQEIAKDPILNYKGGPEAQPILSALRTITSPLAQIGSAAHQAISDIAGPRAADMAGDVVTLAPALRGAFSSSPVGIEMDHPLSDAAQAENERLGAIHERGEDLGLDLPEGGTASRHAQAAATNQPIVNAAVREELQLPQNAPMTPQMLQAARNQYTAPAYQAVRDVPAIPLPENYLGDIDNFDSISEKYRPPVSGTITGEQAVDMSRYLRNKANKYFSAAKGNPEYEDIGQAHWDAAQGIEDSVEQHLNATGQGQLAQAWDQARTYAAKTYSVQNALDGAGNVKVAALKGQLLKGKPLSGDLETLANLGAQYPEAFKTTRVTMPSVGPIRRLAAGAAPAAGAAAGGWLGGPIGAAVGTAAGQHVGERIASP